MNSENKTCQNCKGQFTIAPEDFQFYERIKVASPAFCPDCRLQRRLAFRNERSFYKDTCDLCQKSIVSLYSSDKKFSIYCKECWYSDNWDPIKYGMEFDSSKPFFVQFRELMEKVPRIALMHIRTNINSDYGNYIADDKDIYLSQSVIFSENIYYSMNIDESKDIFDSYYCKKSERGYENVDCLHLYRSKYCLRSRDCMDSAFLFDCVNCQNCFMSTNFRNRQYVIRNEQLTKEQYAEAMTQVNIGSHMKREQYKAEFRALTEHALHKFGQLLKITNCTGNNLENAKNVKNSFDLYDGENLRFCLRNVKSKDSYDISFGVSTELAYEGILAGFGNSRVSFISHCDASERLTYCEWCQSSKDLFGCIGLRKKQYCILNRQYSKEDYENITKKIREQMGETFGEFFPMQLSPFAYNETLALESFPLSKEDVLAKGYSWHNPKPFPHAPTLDAISLPDNIQEVKDSVCKEIIGCSGCDRAYRIMPAEYDFLRQENISLPRKCVDCRTKERFALRNPLKLWPRKCVCDYKVWKNSTKHIHHPDGQCPNEFETSYAPERPEIVYCEQCYQAEVS